LVLRGPMVKPRRPPYFSGFFSAWAYRAGLLSTVQNQIDETVIPATHTTPDTIALNELLVQMTQRGCTHCFMEVSSHALVQQRVAGLHFVGGIFTNITHDHLDFHETFDNYIKAKKSFFDQLPASAFALTNLDDKRGLVMLQNTACPKRKLFAANAGLVQRPDFVGRLVRDANGGRWPGGVV
jgi:UDP-N-acetylmuramoyl-L-alanyl-D-glutamate--2,6-diaminopimelate ligase